MKYKIKQLKDLAHCEYAFEMWDWAKGKFNLEDYDVVYEGVLDGDNPFEVLEKLFEIFNIRHPEDFKGHSLSVSDVVEIDGVNYYCDALGWIKLEV